MSSISIIGLGNMASTLADRALAGDNTVEIIGRDQAKANELAAALGGATVGTADTAPAGDIVILAVPYASAAAVLSEYGDALRGKVIIDITNPVTPDFKGFVTPEGSSGAQEIAKAAPAGAHVVKAFNTLFGPVLSRGGRLDGFIAANFDSPLSLLPPQLARLAAIGGFRRWDRVMSRFITDERLRRIFTFQALYAGVPP